MPALFDPLVLGEVVIPNRVVMAPLTRARATRDHIPTELMATYYAQRASAGLIISEATGIARSVFGWPYAPGIWSEEQRAGWQRVTEAVHAAGGRIFVQLWAMGRVAHSAVTGHQPVSASATQAPGLAYTYEGRAPFEVARALEIGEIATLVDDFRRAAANAMRAGFDGVQLHAANGYLIDQFLRDGSNLRTDIYGGAIENRVRLLREAVGAVIGEIGAGRTAVRLSPNEPIQGVEDSNPAELFGHAAAVLSDLKIAFLEIREPKVDGTYGVPQWPAIAPAMRAAFAGPIVLNSDYRGANGRHAVETGEADAISFGRGFLSNPDLAYRLAHDLPWAEEDLATRYTQGPEGYIDYPALAAASA